jgi:signal transduction histidine kinase
MKQELIRLSQRYVTALSKHLEEGPRANLLPALSLGRRAVALGLETLDMAQIHERAVSALELPSKKDGFIDRAHIFFVESITPIEETHEAARKAKAHLRQLTELLGQRTMELAATSAQLQRGIARRKTVEAALKKNGERSNRLLKDSLKVQEGLRQLVHRVLAAQEDERHKISHQLQDQIAQALLGIKVRLLSLKQQARSNSEGLKNEIASTQQLVANSAKSVRQASILFKKA